MPGDDDEENYLTIDGFDAAFIGLATVWHPNGERVTRAVYNGNKILTELRKQGIKDRDEAAEYCDFNIEGAYMGPATPIVVWPQKLLKED